MRSWTALTLPKIANSQRLSPLSHVSVVSCVLPTLVSPCLHILTTSPRLLDSYRHKRVFSILSSMVLRDTDQGVETCERVSRESHPSGTDSDRKSCGSLLKAPALARVDVPTAPFPFCCRDQGVRHVCTSSFFLQESSDLCSTDNQP